MTEEEVKLLKEMQNNCKNESNYYTDPKAESKAKAIESALKLQQRIDKLNKYIKEHGYDYVYQDCKFNETEQYEDIQSILKDKEVK